jgi:hypothetical protein
MACLFGTPLLHIVACQNDMPLHILWRVNLDTPIIKAFLKKIKILQSKTLQSEFCILLQFYQSMINTIATIWIFINNQQSQLPKNHSKVSLNIYMTLIHNNQTKSYNKQNIQSIFVIDWYQKIIPKVSINICHKFITIKTKVSTNKIYNQFLS